MQRPASTFSPIPWNELPFNSAGGRVLLWSADARVWIEVLASAVSSIDVVDLHLGGAHRTTGSATTPPGGARRISVREFYDATRFRCYGGIVASLGPAEIAGLDEWTRRAFAMTVPGGLLLLTPGSGYECRSSDLETSFEEWRGAAERSARMAGWTEIVWRRVDAASAPGGPVWVIARRRRRYRILFLCTGNSCRSQMAEGWARALKGEIVEAWSAGVEAHGLNPWAVRVMAEAGVDLSGHRSKTVDEVRGIPFDVVVTVCDHAREACPFWPGRGVPVVHRGFDDPPRLARTARTEEEVLHHYRRVRDQIRAFVEKLPHSLCEGMGFGDRPEASEVRT